MKMLFQKGHFGTVLGGSLVPCKIIYKEATMTWFGYFSLNFLPLSFFFLSPGGQHSELCLLSTCSFLCHPDLVQEGSNATGGNSNSVQAEQGGNFYLKDPIRRHFIHGVFASQIHATVLCLERILNANNPEVLRV
jgi:hypothetical protein